MNIIKDTLMAKYCSILSTNNGKYEAKLNVKQVKCMNPVPAHPPNTYKSVFWENFGFPVESWCEPNRKSDVSLHS